MTSISASFSFSFFSSFFGFSLLSFPSLALSSFSFLSFCTCSCSSFFSISFFFSFFSSFFSSLFSLLILLKYFKYFSNFFCFPRFNPILLISLLVNSKSSFPFKSKSSFIPIYLSKKSLTSS